MNHELDIVAGYEVYVQFMQQQVKGRRSGWSNVETNIYNDNFDPNQQKRHIFYLQIIKKFTGAACVVRPQLI